MSDIKEYYDPTVDSTLACYEESYPAQTFLTTSAYRLDKIVLKLSRAYHPVPGGVLSVRLFATTGGKPTGAALADAAMSVSQLSITATWETFSMEKIALTTATTYAIVVNSNNLGNPDRVASWHGLETGVYAGGTAYTTADDGDNWTDSGRDQAFKMYGNDLDYCWCSKVDDTGKCTEIRNGCMEYQE